MSADGPLPWKPVEADLEGLLARFPRPLQTLSRAEVPAFVLRRAYNPEHCRGLVHRFVERGLMRDPELPAPPNSRTRIDIGTNLGGYGNKPDEFFAKAAETNLLFRHLFDGFDNPIAAIYETLSRLAPGKTVRTAREPDGRLYGQAIFRVHYESHAYKPHLDHVTLREKRFDFDVTRFDHQFAGVICIQNADDRGPAPQAILHQCVWTPEVSPYIVEERFPEYVAEHDVKNCSVELEEGDLYFFNTRCIHEVPPVPGDRPRVVLAVFIGYSDDDDEIFVWS